MKYKWVCTCEIGSSERVEKNFKSFEEVNRYVRNIISKHVDITAYINELKSYGNYKYFLDRAEFLKKYIEDPNFPYSEADFPLEKPEDYDDYEELDDFDDKIDIEEFLENGDFYFSKELLDLRDVRVDFVSEFVFPNPDTFDDLLVSFEGRLDITVTKQKCFEPSSYPLMVLKVLEDADKPMSQERIGEKVKEVFRDSLKKPLHRNIIGRIIKMLKDLGLTITRSKEGYLLDKSYLNESPSIEENFFGTKANSVMILLVLRSADTPLTRKEIVKKIKERFHHTIDVKTVGRNVELLQDFDYTIKKFGNKGYLLQK